MKCNAALTPECQSSWGDTLRHYSYRACWQFAPWPWYLEKRQLLRSNWQGRLPLSRSTRSLSSTCLLSPVAEMVPVTSSSLSLTRWSHQHVKLRKNWESQVDFPWSMWAMIEKLRILETSLSNLSEEGWAASLAVEAQKERDNALAVCGWMAERRQLLLAVSDSRKCHVRKRIFIHRSCTLVNPEKTR